MRRRKRIRLIGYDYSLPGAYFVTICTKDRAAIFGDFVEGEMRMNDFGVIVQTCWNELPSHYPQVQLNAFVVMPNHIHGIIIINDDAVRSNHRLSPMNITENEPSVGARSPRPYGKITLGNIIAFFKYQSTKRCNVIRNSPGIKLWQRNYYDHIIRSERSMNRIREYIKANPDRWQWDGKNQGIRVGKV
jgi:putative transposase